MKKRIISSITVTAIMLAIMILANAQAVEAGGGFDFARWGKTLKEDSGNTNKNSRSVYSEKEIYEKGKDAVVLKKDVEKTAIFFEAAGETKQLAKKSAVEYLEEYEALYMKALEEGYTATAKEVDEYINNMRQQMDSQYADEQSKREIQAIMEQFDSEEDYWNYEKEVYKKQLPIQKFTSDLESGFRKKNPNTDENDWEQYFENYKASLVSQENYKK